MSEARDTTSTLLAALGAHAPRDGQEMADLERIGAVIAHGEPWARTSPLHVTASAIVIDRATGRVLLRRHARMKAWMQVGGHADQGESDPWHVALREAQEETGLLDLQAWPADRGRTPVQVVIVPVPAHRDEPAHEHADIRYVMSTDRPDRAAAESDETPLRWLAMDQALDTVVEENLKEYLRRVRDLWRAGP